MKKATMHLMVGLPCSGKTTYARQLAEQENAFVFTPDVWHVALFGDDFGGDCPQVDLHNARHSAVEELMLRSAEELLRMGVSVILDFGFWAKVERDELRAMANELDAACKVHYMDVPLEEISRRLAVRNAEGGPDTFRIAMDDILGWNECFQPPDDAELRGE